MLTLPEIQEAPEQIVAFSDFCQLDKPNKNNKAKLNSIWAHTFA